MSETTPPPLPTRSSSSRSSEKTPLTKDTPLEVPQILGIIFSNLTSHQIRQSVFNSCRGSSKYLGVAQRLVIKADRREPTSGTPFEWRSSFSPASWQALLGAITNAPNLLNLLDLQVLCPIHLTLEALELLRHIGSLLTKLRLEVPRRDGTLLDTPLSLCPKLDQLAVEFSCSEEAFIQELYSKPWSPSVSQVILVAHPSLRSLTLRRIAVDEESLLSLVDICPRLEELVLDQVLGAVDNEIEIQGGRVRLAPVFRSIARIRPGLRRFGFLPCVLSATTELVQATIVPLFSEATEWVFPATSILDIAEICGWSNGLIDLSRVTILTNLEILVRHSSVATMNIGFNLHNYLCSPLLSRHLVQLKAPDVMIPLDCLDMEGVLDSNRTYRKPDPTSWSLMPKDVSCEFEAGVRVHQQGVSCFARASTSEGTFGSFDGGRIVLARETGSVEELGLAARDGIWKSTPGLDWIAHELTSRQTKELTKFIDQSIAEEVFNPIYRHYPLDYQVPAVPGTPSLRHMNIAFVRGLYANADDHGKDGWGQGTDVSVSVGSSTVPNYVINGIDMRYLVNCKVLWRCASIGS
ncbi:hypothetical protein BGZ90_010424 [Linnemannia elongata]|nr:hypothetical protein BGZ90_010424 [Linnemannia elongata]